MSDARVQTSDFAAFFYALGSYFFHLRPFSCELKMFPLIPFCKRIVSRVSLEVVFSARATILKKLPTTSIICPICLMSASIPVSLQCLSFPVSLPLPHDTLSLYFCCFFISALHTLNNLTSLAVHMEENIPFLFTPQWRDKPT